MNTEHNSWWLFRYSIFNKLLCYFKHKHIFILNIDSKKKNDLGINVNKHGYITMGMPIPNLRGILNFLSKKAKHLKEFLFY